MDQQHDYSEEEKIVLQALGETLSLSLEDVEKHIIERQLDKLDKQRKAIILKFRKRG